VVFTLPDELNPLIYSNQKLLYELLFRSAAETMDELSADRKYLGAKTGYITVLHTWGSAMNYHPHLHCIVLGGGLDGSNQWKECRKNFFLPGPVIARVFRGKYMDGLKRLREDNRLEYHGMSEQYCNHYAFKELVNICYLKEWQPYSKETFGGAEAVIKYLGRYTHRIAISNHRITGMDTDKGMVTYRIKDYAGGEGWKEATVSGVEFIRRFLMHVPPKRFVRIRHYGILGNRQKTRKITLCRNLLGCQKYISALKGMNTAQILKTLFDIDICKCRECGSQRLSSIKGRKLIPLPVET
jgi:hypothetical protein